MTSSVYVETLRRAALILGGNAQLRAWLGVSTRELQAWMEGREQPPASIFLKITDLIDEEANPALPEAVRQSRRLRRSTSLQAAASRAARERAAVLLEQRSRRSGVPSSCAAACSRRPPRSQSPAARSRWPTSRRWSSRRRTAS